MNSSGRALIERLVGRCPAETSTSTSTQLSDQQRRDILSRQLIGLLHVLDCRRVDLERESRGEPPQHCPVSVCEGTKAVLLHVITCSDRSNCGTPHCLSSHNTLKHWKYCVSDTCSVCVPLRTVLPFQLLLIFYMNPLNIAELLKRIP